MDPRRTRAAGVVALAIGALAGCSAPEPSPWWLVEHIEPLALRLEVIEQGPWGTEPPGRRRFADPLPLDTVQVTPFIVGPRAPLPIEDLDAAWVLCSHGGGACLDELALHGSLPACERAEPRQPTSCLLDRGPRARFELGLPPLSEEPIRSTGGLRFPQRFRMIAGVPGVAETDTCIELLRRREPMFDCILMASAIAYGPLGTMQEIIEEIGGEVALEDDGISDREFRNRHPEVERFLVTDLGENRWATVPSGGTVDVAPGASLSIEYLEGDDDRDVAPLPESTGDPLGDRVPAEGLVLIWRFGRDVERTRNNGNPIEVTAPAEGDVPIFLVVMDSTVPNRGMAFGWLRVRVSESP
jgi:hypothetical protein